VHLKGAHRVLIVRSDEDNRNIRADKLQNIKAGELGHLDVQKD
jgi:hypothetical protein